MRIGCDLVHIPRLKPNIEKQAFLERIFHEHEVKYCQEKAASLPSFAARFAAKEAFSKALGTGLYVSSLTPKSVWVENDSQGRPELKWDEAARKLLADAGLTQASLSLSHDGEYALASVVLF